MSTAAAKAKINDVVLALMPTWSAHSGSKPLRTERDAEITITATPRVSRMRRCCDQHRPDAEVARRPPLAAALGAELGHEHRHQPRGEREAGSQREGGAQVEEVDESRTEQWPDQDSDPTRPAEGGQGAGPMAGRHHLDHEALPGKQEGRPGHAAQRDGDAEQEQRLAQRRRRAWRRRRPAHPRRACAARRPGRRWPRPAARRSGCRSRAGRPRRPPCPRRRRDRAPAAPGSASPPRARRS